jgi:hypothetical protein
MLIFAVAAIALSWCLPVAAETDLHDGQVQYRSFDEGSDSGSYRQMEASIPEPPVKWAPYGLGTGEFFPTLTNHLRAGLEVHGRLYVEGHSSDFHFSGSLISKSFGKGLDSKAVNIDDVVHLINYIFSGGNPPFDTDGCSVPDC